jgi:hypothetical protein
LHRRTGCYGNKRRRPSDHCFHAMYTPIPVIINVGIPIPKPVPRPILSDVDKPEEELELRPEPPLLLGLVLDVGVELEGAT